MTIDTKKEIETEISIVFSLGMEFMADRTPGLNNKWAAEKKKQSLDKIMAICTQFAEKREKEVQNNVCDQILEELREYRKKYPDANYHDCVGTILGMKIRPFGVLPIKEEYVS